jgi:predicted nucleic acid-binding protein
VRLVINASPLIFLSKVDSLAVLPGCFSEILVPPAVVAEVRLILPPFVQLAEVSDLGKAFVRGALGRLHQGELEVMTLAREHGIGLVALDDRSARRRASQMGLQPIGTLGILLLAHQRGLMDGPTTAAKIDALVNTHGLFVSSDILMQIRSTLE